MKLVFLMYLEDDDELVMRGFRELGVSVFSRLPLEGHGGRGKGGGWYGEAVPYRSRMVFAVLPDVEAERLLEAIKGWPEGADADHPVQAFQVDVERSVRQVNDSTRANGDT
ncbi:MAG: hypothetical protein U5R14_12615 [Gemmatimonadota bacterium]|nr:hypothetical protein [Gemmatimonadota bacterium]